MIDVALVLPTYNRADALRRNLPLLLGLRGVGEVIVVDDGSTDATPAVLSRVRGPRIRVLRRPRNGGAPAARNLGVAAASAAWVLFTEDDCRFPGDFATTLREDASRHGADVVSAPMLHVTDETAVSEALAAARDAPGVPELGRVAGFPREPIVTPLLQAPALVRTSVARLLRFDEGYGGNAYREETDFFVRVHRAGFTCLLTPRTFFWEERRFTGGQGRPLPSRAYWKARNNWRFLRRHGDWLREQGLIRSPWEAQLRFLARRTRKLAAVTLWPGARRR